MLALARGGPLTGRVVSASGEGIADAIVTASQQSDSASGIAGMAVTTGDGAFAVRNLLGVPYAVLARSELAGFGVLRDVVPGSGDIVIPLTPGELGEFQILGPDGVRMAEEKPDMGLNQLDRSAERWDRTRTRSQATTFRSKTNTA